MTSGQETEWVCSYNPGAHKGLSTASKSDTLADCSLSKSHTAS